MSVSRNDLHRLIDLLDEEDVNHIMEIVKKLVAYHDADTSLTPQELQRMKIGEKQIADGEYMNAEDYRRSRGLHAKD